MGNPALRKLLQLAASIAAAVAVAAAGNYLIALQRQTYRADLRDQTLLYAASVRATIEGELSASAFLSQGLVAYVNAQGPLNGERLQQALAALHAAGRHLRSIAVAPDNRITEVYPRAGNEAALGLHYPDVPDQWPAIQRAIEMRRPVLAGPVELVQGGQALVNRTPVYLADGSYWGVISVTVDLAAFLRAAGLESGDGRVRLALRGRDGLGERGGLIAGDPEVFSAAPVLMTLTVPGGTWQLAALPAAGWAGEPPVFRVLPYLTNCFAAVLGLLLWLALRSRSEASESRARLQALNEQLAAANHELGRLSETDMLTGIPNRRGLEEVLSLEWRRCRRHDEPLALLMIDIDHFKAYNDTHGHLRGDECLQRVAAAMQDTLHRAGEFIARSGGEEFMIVLPGVDAAAAAMQAERVRAAVEAARVVHGSSSVSDYVTVSIGVASRPRTSTVTLGALREAADNALYAAKREGRNCVRVAQV